ncbi:MAG: hypothetical protein ACJ8F3_19940 [Xanthobacteraceae bacterium]
MPTEPASPPPEVTAESNPIDQSAPASETLASAAPERGLRLSTAAAEPSIPAVPAADATAAPATPAPASAAALPSTPLARPEPSPQARRLTALPDDPKADPKPARASAHKKTAKSESKSERTKRPAGEARQAVRRFGDDLRDIPVSSYAWDGSRRNIVVRPTNIQDVYYYSGQRYP